MKIDKPDDDEKRFCPAEALTKDFEPSPLPPIAPDGGFAPGIPPPAPTPEATEDNMICLRGPCRHFHTMVTTAGEGNPEGWTDNLEDIDGNIVSISEPRMHHMLCWVQPGVEIELTGDCVFDCSRWEPLLPRDTKALTYRRNAYFEDHPEYAPVTNEDFGEDFDDDQGDDDAA
jgi:hypothetical protein